MKALVRRPAVYLTLVAGFLALLVIARPVWNPAAVPAGQPSNPSMAAAGPAPVVPVVDLDLGRLRVAATDPPDAERDPFRFRAAPQPAPSVQAPRPVFSPPVQLGPPPPPQIPLKYFGFMSLGGQHIAAFSDARGNVINGKEGDVIEGRYRLLRVGPDSVDMAYLDGRARQTIRLTGQ